MQLGPRGQGNGAERALLIPRSSSAVGTGPPVRAVCWQLQVRPANGFGWVPDGFGSALAGAAAATQEPKTTAAPTSKFVKRGLGFASIIATILSAVDLMHYVYRRLSAIGWALVIDPL